MRIACRILAALALVASWAAVQISVAGDVGRPPPKAPVTRPKIPDRPITTEQNKEKPPIKSVERGCVWVQTGEKAFTDGEDIVVLAEELERIFTTETSSCEG